MKNDRSLHFKFPSCQLASGLKGKCIAYPVKHIKYFL